MAQPHIQVILADEIVPDGLRRALERTNATASFWPLTEALRAEPTPSADAVVVVVPEDASHLAGPLRVLFDRLAEQPRATLVLTGQGRALPVLEHPASLPVTFGDASDEQSLSVRLTTILEMRHSLASLHRGLLATRRSGENAAKRYQNQLRLASQVQREFLPETLPRFGSVSFEVLFRPVDYVSGDIYDVHRLDEEHIGIAVADASGHGIPAALLTVYIKRALRGKEIEHGTYRILSPDEVLHRLNEDILDAHLTECPFVAAVYAVLNTRTLEMSLARGGAPYPVHRTARGELRTLDAAGGVVGVLPGARYEVRRLQLQRGDSVLIFSDGLERIVAPAGSPGEIPEALRRAASRIADLSTLVAASAADSGRTPELDPAYAAIATLFDDDGGDAEAALATGPLGDEQPRTACALAAAPAATRAKGQVARPTALHESARGSAWFATLQSEGPTAALAQLDGRQRTLRRMGYPLDDLTVLALEVDP